MTLMIDFAPDEEARLRQRAAEAGKDLRTFVRDAAMESVDRPSLAEVLAPVHEATLRAGVSVDEIDQMADRAQEEARRERRSAAAAKPSGSV